jgi:SAM-dependent methyltransferase
MIDTNRAMIRKFIERAARETKKSSNVLDAGAGEGSWRYLFGHTDYKTQDNCVGEKHWDYTHLDFNCDITKIPCKSSEFDVIILTEVLEHLPEPYLAVKELNRILKRKGKLYLTVPQGWAEHEAPYDFYRYTQYGLKYLLEKAGFKIEKVEKRGGYFKYISFRLWHIIFMPFLNRNNFFKKILGWIVKAILLFFLIPMSIVFYYLDDIFDKDKELTLGYQVVAVKK